MSYKEWKDTNGYFHKGWRNDAEEYHRLDGPAYISYHPNGSIRIEEFWINGKYIGCNKFGFWSLWDSLTEADKQNPNLLKYLSRYL